MSNNLDRSISTRPDFPTSRLFSLSGSARRRSRPDDPQPITRRSMTSVRRRFVRHDVVECAESVTESSHSQPFDVRRRTENQNDAVEGNEDRDDVVGACSTIRCRTEDQNDAVSRASGPLILSRIWRRVESMNGVVWGGNERTWSGMLPELLGEIIRRVEESGDRWPGRRDVVVCGCVCRKWREVTKEIVKSPRECGRITFPSCLKQPGPRDSPLQCLIKRDKNNAMFYLYLDSCPSITEKGKFLLAARKYRRGAHTDYIITLDAEDLSQGSNAYVGKLSSDFLGTNFTIYDSQTPNNEAKPLGNRSVRRFPSKQISPQVPARNFEVGQISYKFNLLKSRGPRRMTCSLKCPSSCNMGIELFQNESKVETTDSGQTILMNKAPRWHENLQCWCLNFHGRVTVASVKNFQLVATLDQSQPGGKGDEETVLLQFGKVGKDLFTMDYRQPLSAFQAFAICLSSFGTKLGCE